MSLGDNCFNVGNELLLRPETVDFQRRQDYKDDYVVQMVAGINVLIAYTKLPYIKGNRSGTRTNFLREIQGHYYYKSVNYIYFMIIELAI